MSELILAGYRAGIRNCRIADLKAETEISAIPSEHATALVPRGGRAERETIVRLATCYRVIVHAARCSETVTALPSKSPRR